MIVDNNMFVIIMMNGIGKHVCGTNVVTIQSNWGLINI